MALRWELGAIENWEHVCLVTAKDDMPDQGVKKGDEILNPLTHVLIWATIGVGIGQLSEKNADEFYARLALLERLDGPYLIRPEGKQPHITPEEVKAHIGLSTNVSYETRPTWFKRMRSELDRYAAHYRKATETVTAA